MGCQCSSGRGIPEARGRRRTGDIQQSYWLGTQLGTGSFGEVKACVKKTTGHEYAVKIMPKHPPKNAKVLSKVNFENMFRNEVAVLKSLDHPNVVKILEVYEDSHNLYVVMEKCGGGELFTRIANRHHFTESDAACICREMLCALKYIHERRIVHRDVKAENFLFADASNDSNIVLVDFGMAVKLSTGCYLRQVCGSPHYVAPELLRGRYQWQVDMWAFGVIMFLMLYGRYPFEAVTQRGIIRKVLQCEPVYRRSAQPPSTSAVDLLMCLLCKDPSVRISADQALKHPWISRKVPGLRRLEISGMLIVEAQRRALADKVTVEEGETGNASPLKNRLSSIHMSASAGKLGAQQSITASTTEAIIA